MKLTVEYVLYLLAVATIIAVVCVAVLARYTPAVTAPKVSFSVARLVLVNDGVGLYLDMQATSTTNARFCINFVELFDPSGPYVVVGDGVAEAANLPVCIEPGNAFKLSFYHVLPATGFSPGRTVLVKFYYSIGEPSNAFVRDDPHHIIVPTRVVSG